MNIFIATIYALNATFVCMHGPQVPQFLQFDNFLTAWLLGISQAWSRGIRTTHPVCLSVRINSWETFRPHFPIPDH